MTHFPVTALRSVDLETPDIGAVGAVLYVRLGARPRDAPRGRHLFAGQRHRSSCSGLAAGRSPCAAACHVSPAFGCGIRGDRRGITAAWGDAALRSRSKSGARWRDGHGYSRTRRRRAALCSPGHPAPRISSIRKPADKTGARQSERQRCRRRGRVLCAGARISPDGSHQSHGLRTLQ